MSNLFHVYYVLKQFTRPQIKAIEKKLESRIHQDGENMRMKEQTNGLRGIQNLSIADAK